MLYTYSIVPLFEENFEENCLDIIDQYKRRVCSCPLFLFGLVPEGDPVWNKVGLQCALYAKYRQRLLEEGVPSGILIQSSLGHGYPLTLAPFQTLVNLLDGEMTSAYCPEDPAFLEYLKDAMRQIAQEHPTAIMLDDDFRLMMRPGLACVCDRHMAEFNRINGSNMTREELREYINTHEYNNPVSKALEETQRASLIKTARVLREVIDSVDPDIQGVNCTSGDLCESVIFTNPEFAGKSHPTIVRVPNGTYAPVSTKCFSDVMRRMSICRTKLKRHGIDFVLAETDTVPYNRYAKTARYLHTHYAVSILDGAKGAKHWITRMSGFEPECGISYRNILAKHADYYERLAELADEIKFVGANSTFIEQEYSTFDRARLTKYHSNHWAGKALERMGLPFYYSDERHGADFVEDNIPCHMTDEQIKALFEGGSVFISGDAAYHMCQRGYGELLGVDVTPWDEDFISGEYFGEGKTCTKQKNHMKLRPINESVEVLSYNYRNTDEGKKKISPAVTVYERQDGKLSVVFCGTPDVQHNYGEGFAFLNQTRKDQLIELLKRSGNLPVYCDSDNQLCLRAGYLNDGALLCTVVDLCEDPEEELVLYLEKKPEKVELLCCDGSWSPLKWSELGNGKYSIDVRVEPMYPVIVKIK